MKTPQVPKPEPPLIGRRAPFVTFEKMVAHLLHMVIRIANSLEFISLQMTWIMKVLNSHESNHNRIDYQQEALSEAQQVITRLQGQLKNIPSTSSQQNPLQSIPVLQQQNQQSLFPPSIQHQGGVNIPVSNNPLQILQNQIPTQIQRQGGVSIRSITHTTHLLPRNI